MKIFSVNNLFAQKQKTKNVKNVEECCTRYILDLNRGNVKVKIIIKEKNKVLK